MERYCQPCIDANKHLKDNELMDNFDNLFIKAEPDTEIINNYILRTVKNKQQSMKVYLP